jgi:hypothetical protein
MMMCIELWRTLDSDFYRRSPQRSTDADATRSLIPLLAAREQRYFADRLQVKSDSAHGERYWWRYQDDVPGPHAEDGHANLDMLYLDVLRTSVDRLNPIATASGEPIPLDDAMLRRFANTFLEEYARPSEIDSGGNIRFDVNGRSTSDVSKDADASDSLCNGWVNLAVVDATVYRMCHDVLLRVGLPDKDGVRQRYLSIANHAALLVNKSFSQPVTSMVPTIVGANRSTAAGRLAAAGLALGNERDVVETDCSQIGLVLDQTPAAGSAAPAGSAVAFSFGVKPSGTLHCS